MNSIYGSAAGNVTGTIYFLLFQISGILFTQFILNKKDPVTRLLCGSVLGSVLLMWMPALFAFGFGFSITAHILALVFCMLCIILLYLLKVPHASFNIPEYVRITAFLKKHSSFLILCMLTFAVFCIMLSNHTLLIKEDGLHTGQCTYGDMSMHLGFITSIARQQTFPPEYSISPGNKLCYPFLCDSISSSIYIWGASLRYAYMLPMYFAVIQVFSGFYCLSYSWLKKASKACLAWFFFFYNGGLAFVYFIDWSSERTYYLKNIFTEYYQTPTNLINNNIRWVNIMVDMLLPQRATLFGYAVLFTCIWLLYRAVFHQEKDLFFLTALLTGSLPMIHTHSFLAMGLISAVWLLMELYGSICLTARPKYPGKIILPAFLILMCALQIINRSCQPSSSVFLYLCLAGLAFLLIWGIYCLFRFIALNGAGKLLRTWGIYLLLILLLAIPQLFGFTFSQALREGFNTGHFNWGNLGDSYLWFYIKNWGIIILLLIPAVLYANRKNFAVISAGFLIWFIVELVAFSPNTYDNNKLLYVAYIFFCCISADYGYELYEKTKHLNGVRLWSMSFLFLSCISALLSLGREVKSDYLIYSNDQLANYLFIENNTAVDATFLTSERHLNEAAVLAGRNIVSGAWIYLGPHGIYNDTRALDVKTMYESPEASAYLYEKYQVSYIIISSWERNTYEIREDVFDKLFTKCFEEGEISLYQINT